VTPAGYSLAIEIERIVISLTSRGRGICEARYQRLFSFAHIYPRVSGETLATRRASTSSVNLFAITRVVLGLKRDEF
jgi:predicted GNAT superfamily acetyltransferase